MIKGEFGAMIGWRVRSFVRAQYDSQIRG